MNTNMLNELQDMSCWDLYSNKLRRLKVKGEDSELQSPPRVRTHKCFIL